MATGNTGATVLHCRAGCEPAAILAALHLDWQHLYAEPDVTPWDWIDLWSLRISYPPMHAKVRARHDPTWHLETIHDYGPEFRLERWRNGAGTKDLRWWSRNGKGEMVPGLLGRPMASLPLYRQSDVLITAATGEPIYLVESESSVDALNEVGIYSTTWPGGASTPPLGKLRELLAEHGDCRVVADHDAAGVTVARRILAALPKATGWIPLTPGHDVRDVLLAGDRRLATLVPL